MTEDQLNTRIKDLQTKRDEYVSTVHALTGAIQDCEYWLTQVKEVDDQDNSK